MKFKFEQRGLLARIPLVVLSMLIGFASARAQTKEPPANPKPPLKPFQLKLTDEYVIGVSLKAKKAKVSEIAAELAKLLKTKVILGPSMQQELITVEFSDLTFEPAMQLLAPHVLVDYEIRAQAQPRPVGVFLYGNDDPLPAADAVVTGTSQAIMIEGNTEESTTSPDTANEDSDLDVEAVNNSLTIKSRHQPLAAVVLEIAETIGVPAEIRGDPKEIVDTEIKQVAMDDAITRISPNLRFYVRVDLTQAKRTPLRLVLLTPQEKSAN